MSLAGGTSERDDALVERQLVFVHLVRPAVWRRDGVLVDKIGDAFTKERFGGCGDFEMQVRLPGISRGADTRKYLSATDAVSGFHSNAAWLQVQIVSVFTLPDI